MVGKTGCAGSAGCLLVVVFAAFFLIQVIQTGNQVREDIREQERTERPAQAETEERPNENTDPEQGGVPNTVEHPRSAKQTFVEVDGTVLKFIPGLSPADVYSKFAERGFSLEEDVFGPDQIWMCTSGHSLQSLQQKDVDVYGVAPNGVISVVAMYVNSSGDDAARVTNNGCQEFFSDVASIKYDGCQIDTAQAWVTKNVGLNTTTMIGGVSFELIANRDFPRSRVLRIQVATDSVSAKIEREQKVEQDPAFREKKAASKVKMAKLIINGKDNSVAKKRLQDVVDDYPETEAAKEAERLLKGL